MSLTLTHVGARRHLSPGESRLPLFLQASLYTLNRFKVPDSAVRFSGISLFNCIGNPGVRRQDKHIIIIGCTCKMKCASSHLSQGRFASTTGAGSPQRISHSAMGHPPPLKPAGTQAVSAVMANQPAPAGWCRKIALLAMGHEGFLNWQADQQYPPAVSSR